jgi:hypothetical protein
MSTPPWFPAALATCVAIACSDPGAPIPAGVTDTGDAAADSAAAPEAAAGDAAPAPDVAADLGPADAGPAPLPTLGDPARFEPGAGLPGSRVQPGLAWGRDGALAVAWTGSAPGGTELTVWFALYDAAGAELVAPYVLATGDAGGDQGEPDVCALADGAGWAVAWSQDTHTSGPDGENLQIRWRRVAATGQPSDAQDTRLLTARPGNHWLASVGCDPRGGFAVAGVRPDDTSPAFSAFLQRYDAAGQAAGEPTVLKAGSDGGQVFPDVALSADGTAFVAWADTAAFNTAAETNTLLVRAVAADGSAGALVTAATAAATVDSPMVAVHPSGAYLTGGTLDGQHQVLAFVAAGESTPTPIALPEAAATVSYNAVGAPTDDPRRYFLLTMTGVGASVAARLALLDVDAGPLDGPWMVAGGTLGPYVPDLDYRDGRLAAAWTASTPDGWRVQAAVFAGP